MITSDKDPRATPRDAWRDACGASVFVSFLVIVGHVFAPLVTGLAFPYAGGGAVVLGIGSTACLGLRARGPRLAAAVALGGLLGLRTLSALMPELFISEHGALSMLDGIALTLLLGCGTMLGVLSWKTGQGPNKPLQPTGFAGG